MSGAVIGVDLGTSNSCVAIVKDGRPEVLSTGSSRIVPSCLGFARGKEVVGSAARRQLVSDPHNTVTAVKRLMGHPYESPEVQSARDRVPYPIRPSPLGSVMLEVGGRDLTPVQVSARILQKIKDVAEEALQCSVEKAVISVPAHFNDLQRKATKLAAEYAGLEVLRLVNEPTAAAFAYGYRRGEDFTLAVYDLGGGTFDITVMMARGDEFEVVATDGDSYLGGEDFDQAITDWLRAEAEAELGADLKGDTSALVRLRESAERAKIELSDATESQIELPYLTQLADGSRPNFGRTLDRDKLAELCQPLVGRTIELCQRCLEEANVASKALDEVLMVGGQSRMPLVREAVREFFGREARRDINPDEVVAMGAALYAYSLSADDLQEEAQEAAGDAFAIALRSSELAKQVVEGVKALDADALDLPALRDRLQELLAQAENLPALAEGSSDDTQMFGSDSPDSLPTLRDAGDADLPEQADALPGKRDSTLREVPQEFASAPQRRTPNEHDFPQAISNLHDELSDLSSVAQRAMQGLAKEIEVETQDGESADEIDRSIEELSEQLSAGLEAASEKSREAEELLEEADVHKNARRVGLIDVTSLALGISSAGDLFTILIDHNTRVPAEKQRVFTTNQDGQDSVQITVRQGRVEKASQNQLLGEFILEGIRPAPRMEPKIAVTFTIDENGILAVAARDQETDAKQSIRVEDPLGLQQTTPEDIERIEREREREREAAAEAD